MLPRYIQAFQPQKVFILSIKKIIINGGLFHHKHSSREIRNNYMDIWLCGYITALWI